MERALWWGVILVLLVIWLATLRASEEEEDDREASDREPSGPSDGTPPFMSGPSERGMAAEPTPSFEPGECSACGTANDPFYTYCRECITPLR